MSNRTHTSQLNNIKMVKLNQQNIWKKICEYKVIYFMLLPAIIYYIIFCYIPLYGITIAFKDFYSTKGILGSPWIGLKNFEYIFKLDKFWEVFKNTIEINILRFIFGFPAPLILSLLLNELRQNKLKRVIQTVSYFPHFISWVTISGMVFSILSNDGVVNTLISQSGGEKISFLTSRELFRPLLVVTGIWKEVGWGTIIYLAALTSISPELYEAATIDGAGRWKQMTAITLPSILPTVTILLIFTMGTLMNGNFDQVFNLYNQTVYSVGDIIDTYIYRIGIVEGKFSMATAVGLFLNVSNFIILISANSISKKINGNGIY